MDRLTEIRLWHADVKMRYDDKPSRAHQDREVLLSEIDKLQAEVERLTRERDEARAALRWYADLTNYMPPVIVVFEEPPALLDKGTLARNALEGKP